MRRVWFCLILNRHDHADVIYFIRRTRNPGGDDPDDYYNRTQHDGVRLVPHEVVILACKRCGALG